MSRDHFRIALAFVGVLLLANLIYYLCSGWGLITIKAHEVPVGQVIHSIERQGWVTIYSNIDPQTKISMYVDHVTLPEAMETLAVNADAQWHLGFFVAPSSARVKEEIRTFTEAADNSGGDTKVYNFRTSLDTIDDGTLPVSDPRKQVWPGLKTPAATPPAAPAPDGMAAAFGGNAPPPEVPPTSVQGYLRSFAQEADVWIMAPSDWDPPVAAAPPAAASISSAITNFVDKMHGSVTQALVLRGRPPRVAGGDRPRGNGGGGVGLDFSMMQDRMDNAINGLPPAQQPAARTRLAAEVQFQKEVRAMPPEQRMTAFMKHMADRRLDSSDNWRRSPEKRAQMFSRMVSNRMAAQGK